MSASMGFNIGPVSIYYYGLALAEGMLAGLIVSIRQARATGVDPWLMLDFYFAGTVAALFGAVLPHVLGHWSFYAENPAALFAVYSGRLVFWAGLGLALLVTYVFARRRELDYLQMLDGTAPGLALAQAIASTGYDASFLGSGAALTAVTGFYASFLFLWQWRGNTRFSGQLFGLLVVLSALVRFVVRFFLPEERYGFLSPGQWVLLAVAVAGSFLLLGAQREYSGSGSRRSVGGFVRWSNLFGFGALLIVYFLRVL